MYKRVPRLFEELNLAHADGTYVRLLARLAKIDVLILDDWVLRHSVISNVATYSRFSKIGTPLARPS